MTVSHHFRSPRFERKNDRGFTLFELMVVVALMSIVVSISLPSFLRAVRKSPLRQAMSDLEEACTRARMMAIMEGRPSEIAIRAADGMVQVRLFREIAPDQEPEPGMVEGGDKSATAEQSGGSPLQVGVAPVDFKLPSAVAFKSLVVNLQDMMDTEEARVRFFPNSTCDAFSATLLSEDNEERTITLEVTTGRSIIEVIR